MPTIHASAVVDPSAELADDVVIGPCCVIAGPVRIGAGTQLRGQVWIEGRTTIGRGNVIFPHVAIGCPPQDWRVDVAEITEVVIGDNNLLRENVTIHRGSKAGGGVTRLGSGCMLMANAHLGHDAQVGDHVTLINNTSIGGHVKLENNVWFSGGCAAHQFVTVGRYAFLSGFTGADHDVPPYCRLEGDHPARMVGVNIVGLRRMGLSPEIIRRLRDCLAELYPHQALSRLDRDALADWQARDDLDEHTRYLVDFVARSATHRFGRFREAGRYAAAAAARTEQSD